MKQLSTTLRRAAAAWRALAPYGSPHRQHLLDGAVAALYLVAARLAFPWPLRGLMEIVFHHDSHGRAQGVVNLLPRHGDPVLWLTGAFVVIIIVWGLAESRQRLAFTRYAVGLTHDLRDAAIARMSGRDLQGFAPGALISTVTGDTSRVKTGVRSILIGISRNGAFFLGVAVIITVMDPVIGLVFVAGGLATVVAGSLGASRSSRITRRSREREGAFAGELHHYLAGDAELGGAPRGHRRPDSKVTRVEGLTTLTVHAILAATTCVILVLTIHDGRTGELSPGSVFTILAYILLMHNKTVALGRSVVRAGRVLPSAERIAALLEGRSRSQPCLQGQLDPHHLPTGTGSSAVELTSSSSPSPRPAALPACTCSCSAGTAPAANR
jgi:ABC-type multidrug transport system fused ATPase/permease subunit